MIAGTLAALASATTHASRRGASPTLVASSPWIVAARGVRQVLSGYMCTPTVCSCSVSIACGSAACQCAGPDSSGPIKGAPPIACRR